MIYFAQMAASRGEPHADLPTGLRRDRRGWFATEPKKHFNLEKSSCCRFAADAAIGNNLLNFSLLTRDRPAGPAVGCVGWAGERLSASPSSAPLPCEEGGWGGRFRVRAHSLLRFGAGHAPRLFTPRCPARREGPPVTPWRIKP